MTVVDEPEHVSQYGAAASEHDLREVFSGLLYKTESSSIHTAVDTLRHPLAVRVISASAENPGEVERLARTMQAVAHSHVDIAWIYQGYTGERFAGAAAGQGDGDFSLSNMALNPE